LKRQYIESAEILREECRRFDQVRFGLEELREKLEATGVDVPMGCVAVLHYRRVSSDCLPQEPELYIVRPLSGQEQFEEFRKLMLDGNWPVRFVLIRDGVGVLQWIRPPRYKPIMLGGFWEAVAGS
jgi:hypothetical protein